MRILISSLLSILIMTTSGCSLFSKKEEEVKGHQSTKLTIYMEKTFLGEIKTIPVFSNTSDRSYLIEIEGADVGITLKEAPKAFEDDIEDATSGSGGN